MQTKQALFLDRDGVLNEEKVEDYIYHWGEFKFYPEVLPALKILAQHFAPIVIVTNQKGVGKGWMTEASLQDIHHHMKAAIEAAGGRIDGIYYCTELDNHHPNRKPQPGMAYLAQQDFPEIEWKQSTMVGNNLSDMEFGRNVGMKTVFLRTTHPNQPLPHPAVDADFDNLLTFAQWVDTQKIR
jgi:D-glycero-D-manno-heptose 1,7-bisphosphate phosphatase